MIYFILNPEANVVKIGYTRKDVDKRLSTLQVGNHTELKLIGVIEGTPKHEKHYHRLFAEYHTKGEWFTYGGKLQEFIENASATTNFDEVEGDEVLSERVFYLNLGKNKIVNFYPGSNWQRDVEPSSFRMILDLLLLENYRTGEIVLNVKNRKRICESMNRSNSQITKCLSNLLEHDVIARIRRGVYMVNPLKMCIGKKTVQQNKLDNYMRYAKSH